MQLTQFTDYALRALIYIAVKGEICTITEIAERYDISRHHLVKVIHKLGQIGTLKTTRGPQGGLELNGPPSEINIGELVQKVEPNFYLVECFNEENKTCCLIPVCKLRKILCEATGNFIKTLSQYTLEDITTNKSELKTFLKL